MKRKVIIDTDPGIDDAIALMFALKHPDLEILGITSVAGNKGLDNTTNNVTRILREFNANILVHKGEEKQYSSIVDKNFNLQLDYNQELIHGEKGLGSVSFKKDKSLISEIDAVTFIIETIKKFPNQVDIITLGPLTNIAYCIEQDPTTMQKVKSIHSMGGGVYRGNRTPVAEFNYWFDPYAVNKVFSLGESVPIHMVGLDVTHQAVFDMNDLTFMKLIDQDIGKMINDMLKDYIQSYWEKQRVLGAVIHDLTTVIGYIYPEIYTDVYHASMECVTDSQVTLGQTVVDLHDQFDQKKNSYIPMNLNLDLYKAKFIEIILGQEALNEYLTNICN